MHGVLLIAPEFHLTYSCFLNSVAAPYHVKLAQYLDLSVSNSSVLRLQHQMNHSQSLQQQTVAWTASVERSTKVNNIQWNLGIRDTQGNVKNCPEF